MYVFYVNISLDVVYRDLGWAYYLKQVDSKTNFIYHFKKL